MFKGFVRWAAVVAVGMQVGGCLTDYGPVVSDSIPAAPSSVASRLQSGDQVKVIVFGEDALSGIYDVSPAGAITMPLIGSIVAVGHTTRNSSARLLGRTQAANSYKNQRSPFPLPVSVRSTSSARSLRREDTPTPMD